MDEACTRCGQLRPYMVNIRDLGWRCSKCEDEWRAWAAPIPKRHSEKPVRTSEKPQFSEGQEVLI